VLIKPIVKLKIISVYSVLLFFSLVKTHAQFYNKEVAASIRIERNSEFLKFFALAENKSPVDRTLEYDFLIFKTQADGTVSKDNDKQRFVLSAYEKKELQTLVLSNAVSNKTIIVLLIYDQDGKPIGKDRIELEQGSLSNLDNLKGNLIPISSDQIDQAAPQDGFKLQGLVIQKSITKAGRDFYKYFYSLFYNKDIKSSKNIRILEVPGRSRTTRISVKIDDFVVWQFFAQPQRKYLEQHASIAISKVVERLQILEQQKDKFIHY